MRFYLESLKRDRPIVLYNIDGYYDKMKALLEYTAEEKFMDFSVLDLVVFGMSRQQFLTIWKIIKIEAAIQQVLFCEMV